MEVRTGLRTEDLIKPAPCQSAPALHKRCALYTKETGRGMIGVNVRAHVEVRVRRGWRALVRYAPWHFLYFLPLPQGQGSLRPVLSPWLCTV